MYFIHTVDGKSPAPVDKLFIPLFVRFLPFKLVHDFFHPQDFVALIMIIVNP